MQSTPPGRARKLTLALSAVLGLHLMLAMAVFWNARAIPPAAEIEAHAGWLAAFSPESARAKTAEAEGDEDGETAAPPASEAAAFHPAESLHEATLLLEVQSPAEASASLTEPAAVARQAPATKPASIRAASTGSSGAAARSTPQNYYSRVQQRLAAAARHLPATATGEARLRFTVLADGSVRDVQLLRSSGNAALDAAALHLPQQAAPLPAPPLRAALTLEVPIRAESQR